MRTYVRTYVCCFNPTCFEDVALGSSTTASTYTNTRARTNTSCVPSNRGFSPEHNLQLGSHFKEHTTVYIHIYEYTVPLLGPVSYIQA